ncbi:P-loop containing nucleoside triphosphate hydrolase protein, partial [Panaeolus papilionaceus]
FNVAIVGESGMGKSTLLNSLRGLLPSDPGAAIPGFNEATMSVQGYSDRYHEWIRWYDVPGANTPTITGWRYFTHQGLFIFDALLVVFCDRFTQTTGTLVSNAEECGIPIFLVRTKADQLIQNIQEDTDQEISGAQARAICLKDSQSMINVNLQKMDLPPRKSYVVSRRTM